ncbi:GNAT family N-acetyltransferase [Brevibacillus ginsengisoli]|uniref:GNAT family N-acetyltransferase n=1 Tax=Brevibacillus ginsengisoli TaxID=363854 RepID=UPI003CF0167E
MMFTIRAEQPGDQGAITEVNLLAFQEEKPAKLVEAIRASEFFIPELSLVAVADEVIGHILFSIVSIETNQGSVPTLALAPMAIKPGYQNQGIGSALVIEGLRRCKLLGYQHVVVLGHPNFYPKFGFVPSRLKGIEPPLPVPDEVFMVIELQENSWAANQGRVKYPPSFDVVS